MALKKYKSEIEDLEKASDSFIGQLADIVIGSATENDFERAFYIAIEELKRKAIKLGANAIVCISQDIDINAGQSALFFLQMYGTAVKIK